MRRRVEELAGKPGRTVEERGIPPPVVEDEPPAARNCRIGGEDGVSRRVHGRSPVSLATKAARIAVVLGRRFGGENPEIGEPHSAAPEEDVSRLALVGELDEP